jgi:hypothetical protein
MVATSMKQIAAVSSGVPNVMLQQSNIESIIGTDLWLAYADGLDFNVSRRGLVACQAEWQLIAATHNLLKLWRVGNAYAQAKTPQPLAA